MRKRFIRRIICLIVALFMLTAAVPVYAGPMILIKSTSPERVTGDTSKLPSDDELFAGYVDRVFYPEKYRSDVSVNGTLAGNNLSKIEKGIYDVFVSLIKQVANGECHNASIVMTSAQMDEIGLTKYFAGMDMNSAWKEFLKQFNFDKIHKALISDYPYDLYWYDKTWGITYSSSWYRYNHGSEIAEFNFEFAVSADYSINGAEGTPYVDAAKTGATAKAADTAKSIVKEHNSLSDYEKLVAYKDEICALVDYNFDALEEGTPYGDPWQLIHVFDGDPSTKVVCEGYSKAFQYLCDLSKFKEDIYCVSVSGDTSGPHMWNIVHMDDGKNYLVDLTNSDDGSIGENGGLFLNGAAGKTNRSYTFNVKHSSHSTYTITYIYDDRTLNCWGVGDESILNISMSDYEAGSSDDGEDDGEDDGGNESGVLDSGKCGDNLTWTLYRDGELVIDGTGDMWDYTMEYNNEIATYVTTAPWGEYVEKLSTLTFFEGITYIGGSAFRGCSFSGELELPDTLKTVSSYAFLESGFSGELVLPDNLTHIEYRAFCDCKKITEVVIPESVQSLASGAFEGCRSLIKATIYSRDASFGSNMFLSAHSDFTIYGYRGSTAETYASSKKHKFVFLDSEILGSIKGHVTAHNPKIPTKLELLVDGEVRYTTEIPASGEAGVLDAYFEFTDISAGTYDLVVTKQGHLSYTVLQISVEDDVVDLNEHENADISTITLISGDVNGDGCVDLKDVTELTSSRVYGREYADVENKSADINGDGCFDLKDLSIITSESNYGMSEKIVTY